MKYLNRVLDKRIAIDALLKALGATSLNTGVWRTAMKYHFLSIVWDTMHYSPKSNWVLDQTTTHKAETAELMEKHYNEGKFDSLVFSIEVVREAKRSGEEGIVRVTVHSGAAPVGWVDFRTLIRNGEVKLKEISQCGRMIDKPTVKVEEETFADIMGRMYSM
jgi:hypothetical protein